MIWNLFLTTALAQTTTAAATAPTAQPSSLETFFPFIVLFAAMYFFMIRPQSKKQKELQKYVSTLKRGDEVITAGGMFGKIDSVTDAFVSLEIANGVRVKMLRSQIAGSSQAAVAATQAPANKVADKNAAAKSSDNK